MCLGPNACANCLYCTGRVGCVGVGVRCIQPTREVGGGDGGRCLAAACVDTMFFAVGTPVHGVQAWWREEAGAGPFPATVEKVHIFSQTYRIVWDDGGSEQRTRPASEVWLRDTVIDDDMTPGEEVMTSEIDAGTVLDVSRHTTLQLLVVYWSVSNILGAITGRDGTSLRLRYSQARHRQTLDA